MADVLVLQHTAPETPGLVGEALAARGHALRIIRLYKGEPVPRTLDDAAALLVMGGPMGVYETDAHPHLEAEMRLIGEALRAGKPLLGICLGSQLLAHALGAPVRPGGEKEIGWRRVTLTDEAADDPLWRGVSSPFVAYHWHGDVFECPAGAVGLARSEQTAHQAFRYGANAYGLLFHLEVTPGIIEDMTAAFADELEEEELSGCVIRRQAAHHLPRLQAVGRQVFGRWADLIQHQTLAP